MFDLQVLAYVREFVPEPRKAPLAGNTVGTDRAFLARDMPTLEVGHEARMLKMGALNDLRGRVDEGSQDEERDGEQRHRRDDDARGPRGR